MLFRSGASKTNSGMFDTGLLHQGELLAADAEVKDEFWEGEFSAPTSGRPEVKVVANGVRPSSDVPESS